MLKALRLRFHHELLHWFEDLTKKGVETCVKRKGDETCVTNENDVFPRPYGNHNESRASP